MREGTRLPPFQRTQPPPAIPQYWRLAFRLLSVSKDTLIRIRNHFVLTEKQEVPGREEKA